MTTLKLIGTYRVRVPEEELRFIAEHVTRSAAEAQQEVDGLALLEVEVHDASNDFDIGSFHQDYSDQVR